ncbi:putative RNA methyltransferase CT0009 [Sesamum angolense]|uniref:RNA methyltransferase CT0009 n=1 Tax=Sesamum angolense TaxID=2727404 RepID=A0AAE1WL99_9LAMI|nr:putative RNA methyltransferase CT0009 [Sesamum angolense]
MAAAPAGGVRLLHPRPWLRNLGRRARPLSILAASSPIQHSEELTTTSAPPKPPNKDKNSPSYYPKRGQTLELVCESLAFKGKGLCKVADTGFVVMCDRALPGEKFIGRVTRKKDNYAEVKKLKTITPHWDNVEAPCEFASHCGGCKTQNLLYEAQGRAKEEQVRELIVHVGKFSDKESEYDGIMKPIVPCDIQFHYRNKNKMYIIREDKGNRDKVTYVEEKDKFIFCRHVDGVLLWHKKWVPTELLGQECDETNGYALGLHAPGLYDKVLNIDKCLLQSDPANKVLAAIQDSWRDPELSLSPYDVHSHRGFLKHLMLRTGRNIETGQPELMVNFVTSSYQPELLKPLVEKIATFPDVVSVMNNVNTSVGNTSVGEEEYTLFGKSTIMESLRGLKFQISANSFFQTNTHQAEILYKLIEDCACLKGDGSEIVLDLFCGTGTIGLTLAKRVRHVYGFEIVDQAVSDARRNANLNGISNATFVQGDLNKIGRILENIFQSLILSSQAARIIYVSCNPATCARDLDYLCHGLPEQNITGCYKLKSIQPVDMFPHTPHIECVCLLELC